MVSEYGSLDSIMKRANKNNWKTKLRSDQLCHLKIIHGITTWSALKHRLEFFNGCLAGTQCIFCEEVFEQLGMIEKV
jgi:hypothetical protein